MYFNTLHHIAIICSNYKVSKDFYTKILGFTIVKETFRESNNTIKLDLALNEDIYIELFYIPKAPLRSSYPEANGLRHLAFEVKNINQVITYLRGYGIKSEEVRIDPLTNRAFTFFADPDGLPLEIYQA